MLLFLLSTNSVPQNRRAMVHNGWLRAEDYLKLDPESQRVYAMGLLDGMYYAPVFGAPDNNKLLVSLASCIEKMKASQVSAIIEKYVKENPEHWNWDLNGQAYAGLRRACPPE